MTDKPEPQKQPRPQRGQLKLEIPADLLAEYANFVLITHSTSEIVLNFAQVLPNMPKVRVQSRVVFTPTDFRIDANGLVNAGPRSWIRYFAVRKKPSNGSVRFRAV